MANSLVTAKDRQTATKALAKATTYCGDLPELSKGDGRKKDLESASGNNWVLKQMKGAKDRKEFEDNMKKNIDVKFFLEKGGPIVAAILFFVSYFICCWSACPCCKCCRCCKKKREVNRILKFVGWVVLLGMVVGIVVSALMSRKGFNEAVRGFKHTSCSGALLVNSTLSGKAVDSHPFLGLIPTLDTFQYMIDSLASTSMFIQELTGVITNTKEIEDSVTLAAGTLSLLRDMMASSANQRPKKSNGQDLLHECVLCPQLEKVLTPAIDSLNDGLATKLKAARGEVKKQLQGKALTDLQKTVKDATEPMKDLKKLVIDSFGFIVDEDDLQKMTKDIDKFGLGASVALILLAFLVTLCACSGMSLWTCREIRTEKKKDEVVVGVDAVNNAMGDLAEQAKKYRGHVHRCALCTWCCGCYYLVFALFIGGLLTAISVPLASVCLILDDVNSQMLTDIGGVLPVNFTGDGGEILKDTIDKCFRNPDKSANPYLLDIIFTRNASGVKVPLRATIVDQTKDMINKQFDQVTKQMNTGNMKLNTDPNIIKLKKTIRDTQMDAMLVPDANYDWQNSPYREMVLNDQGSSDKLALYFASSGACAQFVVPAGMGRLSGQTVKGIDDFKSALRKIGLGYKAWNPTCAREVLCMSEPGTGQVACATCAQAACPSVTQSTCDNWKKAKACAAGNKFMKLKQDLRSIRTFKCKKFVRNGMTCDVKNMVKSFSGYSSDCLDSSGKVNAVEYSCSLAEFTTLVSDFDTRFDNVFKRLDNAAAVTKDKITLDMKGLVDQYVIKSIERVADGLTCGFLGKIYQKLIDGACYSGVWGFSQISTSYVICASLTLVLVIMMYIVWRISVDNFNLNNKKNTGKVANDPSSPKESPKSGDKEKGKEAWAPHGEAP